MLSASWVPISFNSDYMDFVTFVEEVLWRMRMRMSVNSESDVAVGSCSFNVEAVVLSRRTKLREIFIAAPAWAGHGSQVHSKVAAGKLGCATVRSERPDDVMLVRLASLFFLLAGIQMIFEKRPPTPIKRYRYLRYCTSTPVPSRSICSRLTILLLYSRHKILYLSLSRSHSNHELLSGFAHC
jgi:hypothetical protein